MIKNISPFSSHLPQRNNISDHLCLIDQPGNENTEFNDIALNKSIGPLTEFPLNDVRLLKDQAAMVLIMALAEKEMK